MDIFIDEDLHGDFEVMSAVKKYADIVETNHNVKIDIKSFPAALVLDKQNYTLVRNSTAEELKEEIRKS